MARHRGELVHRPEQLTRDQLAAVLRDLADGFESGDTLEGNIAFSLADTSHWDVVAAYRTGNLRGQGFMRVIGTFGG